MAMGFFPVRGGLTWPGMGRSVSLAPHVKDESPLRPGLTHKHYFRFRKAFDQPGWDDDTTRPPTREYAKYQQSGRLS